MSYFDTYLRPSRALGHRNPRTLSLRDYILQAYLPYFTANHFRNESDVEFILDGWLRSHPDLRDSSLNSPVSERTFRKAFYLVIRCMVEAEECGDPPSGAGRRLIGALEDLWVDDMCVGSGRGANRATRLFRALAEVSNAASSGSIGSVLRTFFLGWLYEIAEEEDSVSLAGWCSGILRSCMDPRDKQDCLRAITALRPDVIAEMHGRGSDWLSLQSTDVPVRKWPRRRRADGRQWWDRENDSRIRRLIEDQEYLDHAIERNRRNLDLRLPALSHDYWPRHIGRSRSSGSLDRALRKSRSPIPLLIQDEDDFSTRRSAPYLDDVTYDDSLREARLERRFREIGPAAYIEGITTRDSLRDLRLSRPRIRDVSI
ncbi:hypothetical protein Q7P35_003060 [Cladosporium inversicolor]